jgi:hypothetical protein
MEKLSKNERIDRIRQLAEIKSDTELAKLLESNQPQISRWRNTGHHQSTANLIDFLLSIISNQKKEIDDLNNKLRTINP